MRDSILVPGGCCSHSCVDPRDSFEQLLMSAVVQFTFWAVEVFIVDNDDK
jgi:hypothetical protein